MKPVLEVPVLYLLSAIFDCSGFGLLLFGFVLELLAVCAERIGMHGSRKKSLQKLAERRGGGREADVAFYTPRAGLLIVVLRTADLPCDAGLWALVVVLVIVCGDAG
ncbi:MAG: hypothetical protein ACRYGR_05615, partial [Janthinobacterium lividum]